MVGLGKTYSGTLPENVIDVFGIPFASIGSLDGEEVEVGSHGSIKRFTVRDGVVVGCQLYSNINSAGLISAWIKKKISVKDLEKLELLSTGRARPFGHASPVGML
jgi:hypothetical protein